MVQISTKIFLKPSTKVPGSRPYSKVTSARDLIVRLPLKKRAHWSYMAFNLELQLCYKSPHPPNLSEVSHVEMCTFSGHCLESLVFQLWWRSRRRSEVRVLTFRAGWTLQIPLSSISDRPQIPKYACKASGWLSGHLANPPTRRSWVDKM